MSLEQRELLELAAKACGLDFEWNACAGAIQYIPQGSVGYVNWNPRTDDGDCARMESALLLRVVFHDGWVSVGHESFGAEEQCEFYSPHGGDRNAARRLASTYVAAQIGRAMP